MRKQLVLACAVAVTLFGSSEREVFAQGVALVSKPMMGRQARTVGTYVSASIDILDELAAAPADVLFVRFRLDWPPTTNLTLDPTTEIDAKIEWFDERDPDPANHFWRLIGWIRDWKGDPNHTDTDGNTLLYPFYEFHRNVFEEHGIHRVRMTVESRGKSRTFGCKLDLLPNY